MDKQIKTKSNILPAIDKLQDHLSKQQQCQLVKEILLVGIKGEETLLELLIDRRVNNKIKLSYFNILVQYYLIYNIILTILMFRL